MKQFSFGGGGEAIFLGGLFPGGNFLGGNFLGGIFSRGFFPGGIFPDTQLVPRNISVDINILENCSIAKCERQ